MMANWKAAGPDLVQAYWFKKLTRLHSRLQLYLQDCVSQGNVPKCMVRRRRVLKSPLNGTLVNNYRPITCLPITQKLLVRVSGKKLFQYLKRNGLLLDELKGCREGSHETKYQLLVNKAIPKNFSGLDRLQKSI